MAQGKMCPLLTAGVLKSQTIPVDEDGAEQADAGFSAMQCQGEACALWVAIADESGKRTNQGNCALPLSAVALSQINVSLTPKSKLVKG